MKNERVSVAEARRLIAASKKKRTKYRNAPIIVEGIRFDSTKEAKRWGELRMMEKAGLIVELERQVRFDLTVRGVHGDVHVCDYIADACYFNASLTVYTVEDTKGRHGSLPWRLYLVKKALMLACFGIVVREV